MEAKNNAISIRKTIYQLIALIIILGAMITGYYLFVRAVPKFTVRYIELGGAGVEEDVSFYLDASEYVLDKAYLDTSNVDVDQVGDYTVYCYLDNRSFKYRVSVVDTTRPTVEFKTETRFGTENEYYLDDLVDVTDMSELDNMSIWSCRNEDGQTLITDEDIFYVDEPGIYEVEIVATDVEGNTTFAKENIEVMESPKFLLLADRQVKLGDDFDLNTMVYAEDKNGVDISDRVTVVDDGGFDPEQADCYEVVYQVTDDEGVKKEQTAQIDVGYFDMIGYGIEDEEYAVNYLSERGYFEYTPFDVAKSVDEVVALTEPTALSIYNSRYAACAYVYSITPENVILFTAKHCSEVLDEEYLYITNYKGEDSVVDMQDVTQIDTKTSDGKCVIIPTDRFSFDFLASLKQVYLNIDAFESLKAGSKVIYNCQEVHSEGKATLEDVVGETSIYKKNMGKWYDYNMKDYVSTMKVMGRPGCSGSPVFDEYGNNIGTLSGSLKSDIEELGTFCGIDILLSTIN